MSISKDSKKELIKNFSNNNLTEHFKTHNKDKHSKRGLVAMVNKRKKLLNYLSKKNNEQYKEIIKKLNIRG